MAEMDGHWSGMILDAEGLQGRLELELRQEGSRLEGQMSLVPVDTHPQEPQKGRVEGEVGDDGTVRLVHTVEERRSVITFDARRLDLKVHARAALYGTYAVEQQEGPSAGVAILWLYERD